MLIRPDTLKSDTSGSLVPNSIRCSGKNVPVVHFLKYFLYNYSF